MKLSRFSPPTHVNKGEGYTCYCEKRTVKHDAESARTGCLDRFSSFQDTALCSAVAFLARDQPYLSVLLSSFNSFGLLSCHGIQEGPRLASLKRYTNSIQIQYE